MPASLETLSLPKRSTLQGKKSFLRNICFPVRVYPLGEGRYTLAKRQKMHIYIYMFPGAFSRTNTKAIV